MFLAYGDQGFGDIIPARSTLIFKIELLKLEEGPAEEDVDLESPEISQAGEEMENEDLFSEIDTDGDKHINVEEMAKHLMKHEGKTEKDDVTELYTMVGEIFQSDDKDKDGVLSYEEFMAPSNEHDEL